MINLEELRRLATEATPGPWALFKSGDVQPHQIFMGDAPGSLKVSHYGYSDADKSKARAMTANAEYIAAANPATILALLDEVERLREKYNELILAVGMKWPDETRHETALRYIRRAEQTSSDCGVKETKA